MADLKITTPSGEIIRLQKLPLDFYDREVTEVAKELLGKFFLKKTGDEILAGKIVETEAYDGRNDEAAHSYRGKTPRNEVMFRKGGHLYVYFIYGVYFCCNIVTGKEGEGTAVLLRAMEPVAGIETFAKNRFGKRELPEKEIKNLLNGPGKICQAFGINREENGSVLFGEEIFLAENLDKEDFQIEQSPRIGIKKSADLPWRFFIKDSEFVSKK
jgi:DNA-3-methyladenine glycosylase